MRAPTEPAEADAESRIWGAVLDGWHPSRGGALLRKYSDAVNGSLIRDWIPADDRQRVLKTDLFDEAVGVGLYPVLRERAGDIVGVDLSTDVLDAARARYPGLEVRQADVRELGLPDCAFDAVVSNSTLDHFQSFDDIATALSELRRVLVPGGRLLLTLDNADNPVIAARSAVPDSLLLRLQLIPYPTGTTCGRRRLSRLLVETGFEIESLRAIMHVPRVLVRAAAGLVGGEKLLEPVLACERLGAAPTRYLTGQFVAALARRA